MRLILFLSLITLLPLAGCQRDHMNSKNLTTANVKRSLPVTIPETRALPDTTEQPVVQEPKTTITGNTPASRPANVKKQEPEQSVKKTATKSYHVIVASHPREDLAQKDVEQLKAKGYPDAQIIVKDGRYRVSVANNPDKQEASKQRDRLAGELGQGDIWVMLY